MPSLTRLALFDLDHTLIPFDSGMAWTTWLSGQGLLPADAPERYVAQARSKGPDGLLDIRGLHRATVGPLAAYPRAELDALLARFEADIAARLPPQRLALVQQHRDAGDTCVLITATTRFLAEPFGRLFGMHAVLATESTWTPGDDPRLDGELRGEPCWREHKLTHLHAWLAREPAWREQAVPALLAGACFYSDADGDLPLLRAVGRPVAVRPNPRLRAEAQAQGWPVIDD